MGCRITPPTTSAVFTVKCGHMITMIELVVAMCCRRVKVSKTKHKSHMFMTAELIRIVDRIIFKPDVDDLNNQQQKKFLLNHISPKYAKNDHLTRHIASHGCVFGRNGDGNCGDKCVCSPCVWSSYRQRVRDPHCAAHCCGEAVGLGALPA
jgi:hypothetical protein